MKNRKQLLFYIVVNIIISAATTLLVLWLWDRPNRAAAAESSAASAAYPFEGGFIGPTVTPIPLDEQVIRISNVFGVGDLQNEVVELERIGEGDVLLTGWTLTDEDRHVFEFPDNLVMYKGGKIEIHTRNGTNSVIERYWGEQEAVWQSGETVSLLDAQGNVRATYVIP